jgi:release factor glutamine methyltransferase
MFASTVAQALALAHASGLDALDAQVLLSRCLGQERVWLFAHDAAPLDAGQSERFAAFIARRAVGEPLAYLIGEKEFRGLSLRVAPAVLIPRPETEHLVEWGLEILGTRLAQVDRPQVLDLGTGSGAIALALKAALPQAEVSASDVSAQALRVARGNARHLALKIEFLFGDWWAATENRRFHLVLCNPPYIANADPHLAALAHEPALALTPGPSGMEALRAVIHGAATHLQPTGWLLLEHGFDHALPVSDLLRRCGFTQIQTRRDLAGLPRCSGGCLAGS